MAYRRPRWEGWQGRGGGGRGRGGGRGEGDADGKGAGGGDLGADVIKLLKLIKQREIQPVIVFAFSRKCTAAVPCRVMQGSS